MRRARTVAAMRSERGQASVEWIVLALLLALALTALARFAPGANAGDVGADLVSAITCAARGGCEATERARGPIGAMGEGGATRPAGGAPPGSAPRALVTAPPLVPVAPRAPGLAPRGLPGARPLPAPRARAWLRPPRFGPLVRRARRRAGVLWRRSWILCLGYERVRYSVLHPDIRFTQRTIPLSEGVRIANDCLSPVDLVRDFGKPPKP